LVAVNLEHKAKSRKLLLFAVVLLVLVIGLEVIGILNYLEGLHPQTPINQDDSNLLIKGEVASVSENHRSEGMGSYHIYRYFISVNISEVVWAGDDLESWINDYGKEFISVGKTVGIGYDDIEEAQLFIGQTLEIKGHYEPRTDSPQSLIITVASAINGSYLKTQNLILY
jgi:hypothetical protein